MRTTFAIAATLLAVLGPSSAAAQGRRPARPPRSGTPEAASQGDYRFTPALRAGQRLDLSNIDGTIAITQTRSGGAEIVVHKVVRRGNGDLVKAVLEETPSGARVCTVYLDRADDPDGCDRREHRRGDGPRDPLDVEMNFEVRVPAGVELGVNTVDGSVEAHGVDASTTIRTVDGDITYDGVAPDGLNTVDGKITATITNAHWEHDVTLRSVDGSIDVTLPSALGVTISGQTVDGEIHADFPVTLEGRWGPRSFRATMGSGGARELQIHTVDGAIRLHRSGS